jgi:hypothetical protein
MANGEWTEDQKKVMRWLALPDGWKQPETFRALCRSLNEGRGTPERTVYSWISRPTWKPAASKMALLTMLEVEPLLVKARLENMLSPGGWQERVNYDRYVREKLNDMHAQHMFDEVLDHPSEDRLLNEGRQRLAAERLSLLPAQQRQEFQELLADLVGLQLDHSQIIGTNELTLCESDTTDGLAASLPVEMWVNPREEAAKEHLAEQGRTLSQGARDFIQHRDGMKSVTPQGLQALKKKTIRKKRGRYNKGKDNTSSI